MKFHEIFRSGAGAFFFSILLWGIGVGCFAAALNNYLSGIHNMDSIERGWLEFFREMPESFSAHKYVSTSSSG